MHKIPRLIPTSLISLLEEQRGLLILWLPIFFALGIIFYNFVANPQLSATLIFLLLSAITLAYFYKSSYQFLLIIAILTFLCGYSWNYLFDKKISPQNEISGKIYGQVEGRIDDVRIFHNPINKKEGIALTISNLTIRQITKAEQDKKKQQKPKKIKKEKEFKLDKKAQENWLNISGFQEIDLAFIAKKEKYEEINWVKKETENGERFFHPNPPNKISVLSFIEADNLQIGDIISFSAFLEPNNTNDIPNSAFNKKTNAKINRIGAQGFVTSKITIIIKSDSNYRQFFDRIRQSIENKFLNENKVQESSIANALITGNRSLISKENLQNITNSGLIHLLSISGLHMAIAAGIFFISIRFLLLRSQHLALCYNIKKISAIFAIISCYLYLEISGAPIPAKRSFFMICLVFLAIIFDKKPDMLRYLSFAALLCLLANPYNLFFISFQLSFAAIAALIIFGRKTNFLQKIEKNSLLKKSLIYLLGIAIASILAQIATLPFLMYYFNNFAVFGILANMLAIPIVSFITMPLGFLAIFLIPLGIEQIALQPMYYSVDLVIKIAAFVANLKYSYFDSVALPISGIILATIGGLIICLTRGKTLTTIGIIIFLSFPLTIFFIKKPSIIIDGEAKFFAIFDEKDGLIFSKKMRPSRKINNLLQAINEKDFRNFSELPQEFFDENNIFCDERKCLLKPSKYTQKTILILLKRNQIEEICQSNFDTIINLTAKYLIPPCVKKEKILINNFDLLKNGTHFIHDK